MAEVACIDLGQRVAQRRAQRGWVRIFSQLLQVVQQHLARVVGVVQQEMHPGPGLLIVGALHLNDVLQRLQSVEVRLPIVDDGDAELS